MPQPKRRPALSEEAVAYLSDVEKKAVAAQDKANEAMDETARARQDLANANARNVELAGQVDGLKQILGAVSVKDDRVERYLSTPSDDLVVAANTAYLAAMGQGQGHPQAIAAAVAAVLSCVKQEVCR